MCLISMVIIVIDGHPWDVAFIVFLIIEGSCMEDDIVLLVVVLIFLSLILLSQSLSSAFDWI
jgi:hypothetical protein